MEGNRYKITEDNAVAGMVAEPTPTVRPSLSVQEIRHCLVDAIYSSKILINYTPANGKPVKEYRSKYRAKTDEELSAELSQFPSWDEMEYPDLSNIDYRQYKHKKSPRTIKAISKWL